MVASRHQGRRGRSAILPPVRGSAPGYIPRGRGILRGRARVMVNTTSLIVDVVGRHLVDQYRRVYDEREPDHTAAISAATRLALERIGMSDALYHNVEHTVMVTLVGTEILRGREIAERLTPTDWLHMTVAL